MYCKNCGKEIDDNADVCIYCGSFTKSEVEEDNGGFGWSLLGCCVPIVGLILYFLWKDSKPNNAKAVGKGALISVIVVASVYLLLFMFGILAVLI